jgi:hypothetical protein
MTDTKITVPSANTLSQAFKLSIQVGLPIESYFYIDSCRGKIYICANETDKIIYKNNDEHTSPISNIYKVEKDYLIVTENTIYILSSDTKVTKMPDNLDIH